MMICETVLRPSPMQAAIRTRARSFWFILGSQSAFSRSRRSLNSSHWALVRDAVGLAGLGALVLTGE